MKTYLFTLIVVLTLVANVALADPPPPPMSMQFINQILRPCVSGATPFAKVEANPGGVVGNVAVTTCVGGQLLLNGVPVTTGGSGTVTSVGLALPVSVFSISGSPVTTTGTLTGAFINQTANTVFAGPTTGAAAAPAFRALVGADLPLAGLSSIGAVDTSTQSFAGNKSFFGTTTLRQGDTIYRGNTNIYSVFDFSVTGDFKMAADQRWAFSNTAGDASQAIDTALGRNAAGVVEVNNGTAGTFRDLTLRSLNARGTSNFGVAGVPVDVVTIGRVFIANSSGNDFMRISSAPNILQMANDMQINWGNSSNPSSTMDTGLTRNAAGVVEVNDSNAGTFRDLRARRLQVTIVTVATLPTCNAGAAGTMSAVNDATLPTFLGTVAGGGAVVTPVFCDGTNWIAY